ncbi:hypothetical protein I3760_12G026000 [Carya illinoinensis]|nr:hypothetical protein I3760_12G026000 [Carya illinoinensis]
MQLQSPVEGSSELFQEVRFQSKPESKFDPIFISGNKVCFSGSISLVSRTTRFPESKSCTTGLTTSWVCLDDQSTLPTPSTTTMFPRSLILKVPEDEFESGLSLFATQTTVLTGIFLYHIPRYHFELPGSKNPSLKKTWPGETRVCSFVSD